jgi:citrate synthase
MNTAKLILDGKDYEFPVFVGTEGEVGIVTADLRNRTGAITLDPGYMSTGSCTSAITFIDGDKGILRYRGYDIEDLAEKGKFPCVAYLLIYGHLPTSSELLEWRRQLTLNSYIHEDMMRFFDGFPTKAHPMAILSAMVASLAAYYPDDDTENDIIRVMAQAKTIAAFSYKKAVGQPRIYPRTEFSYCANFLRMMFATPAEEYVVNPIVEDVLNLLLIIHADHEQNCSTSTVRMVGSSRASLFSAISAGISALWGPLHGGANQAVLDMLQQIQREGGDPKSFMERVKRKEVRLMGFGHRVYKNYDPRAKVLRKATDRILKELNIHDPLLDLAMRLEEIALSDEYFVERRLYPNVDFYSGILYRAIGIPEDMFTVMFSLARIPGWIAHWREMLQQPDARIHRPRQIYTGPTQRDYVAVEDRAQNGGCNCGCS